MWRWWRACCLAFLTLALAGQGVAAQVLQTTLALPAAPAQQAPTHVLAPCHGSAPEVLAATPDRPDDDGTAPHPHSHCAACCVAGPVSDWAAPPASPTPPVWVPRALALHPQWVPGGLERPPRTRLG